MRPQNKETILIVLIAGIGDLILASKAIRAIRNGHPDAQIWLLTSSDAGPLARNYPYIDRVWEFPARELRKNKRYVLKILKMILELRRTPFSFIVNLYRISSFQGALKMGILFLLLRGLIKAGHNSRGFGLFIRRKAGRTAFQNRHFTDAMSDIARLAGGMPDQKGIEVFWRKESESAWSTFFKAKGEKPLFIGINPGADRPQKQWNPIRFAHVADQLQMRLNAQIILFGGPGEENLAHRIQDHMEHSALNLAGRLTLNDLASIMSRLDLLITNDSGPMHLAAAVKTPLVALFGPEDPLFTRPYTQPDLYRIVAGKVDCRPCRKERCICTLCLDLISPEKVVKECLFLLNY